MRRAKKGHFLVEMIVSMGVVSLLITASMALISTGSRSLDRTGAQVDVDAWATIGIQQMMEDLREAKRVEIVSAGHLRVFYPLVVQSSADGVPLEYDRQQEDPDRIIEFYRASHDGTASTTGATVWRLEGGAGRSILQRPGSGDSFTAEHNPYVTNLVFESNNPSSVDVTLAVGMNSVTGLATCSLTHRAIFLRNY
jgi:hypothetical protein